ncbi:IclR family transcriptional regulator [Nocardioidaceae bacterium SCSIO 66511]|nr:IclR family transcriptional regulator [Nocardioidaceae bacterium SCSIO 66511]
MQQVDDNGTYAAGPTLFAVAAAVRQRDSLWRAAAPFLREIAAEHNETTYLTVRDGVRVVFTDQIESTHQLRYVVDLNKPYPLTTGAAGRAILGALTSDAIDRILDEGLVAYTPQSIADPQAYRAQLAQDRELGYAYSASGWVVQGAGVASPYFDAEGECVGALTISAPVYRLDAAAAERLGPSVRSSANALSRRLGWSGRWGPPDGP